MRYTADEKREIIKLVEQSSLPVSQTPRRLDINQSTFYNWLQRLWAWPTDSEQTGENQIKDLGVAQANALP